LLSLRAKRSNLFHSKETASSLRLLAMAEVASDSVLPKVTEKLNNIFILFNKGR
jgi:hypothetical protein